MLSTIYHLQVVVQALLHREVKQHHQTDPYAEPSQAPGQQSQPGKDCYQTVNIQACRWTHIFYLASSRTTSPSMSDNNLASSSVQYYQRTDPGDLAVDLSTMKQAYGPGYLGMGAQYGSLHRSTPSRRWFGSTITFAKIWSMSNINAEYSYLSRDLGAFQESNLAHYSATTAREISRMCAALNSMEQFGSRYTSNPELLQYGAGRAGPAERLNLQQGLASIRANLLYGPDGRPTVHGQTLTNLINARQASLRSLYPPAVRTVMMIYSTINTPIASTLPITTQPALF